MTMYFSLGEKFREIAAQQPEAPALVFEAGITSFSELDLLSERILTDLVHYDVGKGDVVAIQLYKSVLCYALVIACLKLGAPYVFIAPDSPKIRRERVLVRCQPALFYTNGQSGGGSAKEIVLSSVTEEKAYIDRLPQISERDSASSSRIEAPCASDPAYIMFTSGSTGEPKGAAIPHIGVLMLSDWAARHIGLGLGSRLTAINPLHFDNSVFDLYAGLFNGASIVPVETGKAAVPHQWVRSIGRHGCTFFFAVPTLFLYLDKIGLLKPEHLPTVKTFMFGGEGYPISQLKRFYDRFEDSARLINVYGPTETSCICSSYRIDRSTFSDGSGPFAPIGEMHRGFLSMVLDSNGNKVTDGETGELWIGGPCVGLGYFNDPDATQKSFNRHPIDDRFRSFWYRTGDLVRRKRGTAILEFCGRADNQVKIRGFRIELEEIENVVSEFRGVERCVAIVVEQDRWEDIHLAVEVTGDIPEAELRQHCAERLPSYMQPSRFTVLDTLPLNANGKVDRSAIATLIKGQQKR